MPKTVRRLSNLTTLRGRTPTNQQTADNNMQMVFDHSQQKAVLPDRNPRDKRLIEATHALTPGGYRTMNKDGRPMALGIKGVGGTGVELGGAPDAVGSRKL